MMPERFARRRKIVGFAHFALDGRRCGAGVEPKRMELHDRTPVPRDGIRQWSLQ